MVQWLLESGADVNAAGNRQTGNTALHRAAECGFVGVVQALLGAGADVSITNTVRESATHTVGACGDAHGPPAWLAYACRHHQQVV